MTPSQALTQAQLNTLRNALYAAIQWEVSLADCWGNGTPERKKCQAKAAKYRKLRDKMFPANKEDGTFPNTKTITVQELMKQCPSCRGPAHGGDCATI